MPNGEFDLVNPRVLAYVETHALALCNTIEMGLKSICIDAIAEGMRQGESIYLIRRRLTDTIKDYSKVNAQRVARTEVINASRRATVEGYIQSGVVERVRWLAAPDVHDCECVELNGREFELSEVPDSPHPNCRCTTTAILRK